MDAEALGELAEQERSAGLKLVLNIPGDLLELTAASSNYLSQFQLFNKCCPLAFQDSIHWGPVLKLRKETRTIKKKKKNNKAVGTNLNLSFVFSFFQLVAQE